jgi:AcrR family transcriptional regulator
MGKKGEGNRQRIVDAAEDLFYKSGYNQTSFQDISDATDIPRGNFYYYFKTKEDILTAVVEARVDSLKKLLARYDAEILDPRERLLMFSSVLDRDANKIIAIGCKSKQAFVVLCDWMEKQFDLMGLDNPDQLAMDLVARLQGIHMVANVFKDPEYLKRSSIDLKKWISEQ